MREDMDDIFFSLVLWSWCVYLPGRMTPSYCKKIKITWEGIHIEHYVINTLRLRQNGQHFPDKIFKCIFLNENISVLNTIWLKFVPKGPIDNDTTLGQIMAWRWQFVPKGPIDNDTTLGQIMAWRWQRDKPLSEPMMVSLLTHMCWLASMS